MNKVSDFIGRLYDAKWSVMLAVITLPIAVYVWLDLIYKFLGFLFE